jgi:hypothetical protein
MLTPRELSMGKPGREIAAKGKVRYLDKVHVLEMVERDYCHLQGYRILVKLKADFSKKMSHLP